MLLFPCKNFLHYWDRFQGKIGVPDREKNLWERGQEPATNLTYLLCSGRQMLSPLHFSCSILALRLCSTVAPPLLYTRSTHALPLPQPSATPCSIFAPTVLRPCYTLAPPSPCKGNWGLMVMGFCKTLCKLLVVTHGTLTSRSSCLL